jgi:hypothetical protein
MCHVQQGPQLLCYLLLQLATLSIPDAWAATAVSLRRHNADSCQLEGVTFASFKYVPVITQLQLNSLRWQLHGELEVV